eukprot:m.189836 g.189836  ORF g.189836 m.189836 type:complete len:80 (-) comp14801_c0_seq1:175-414(-)
MSNTVETRQSAHNYGNHALKLKIRGSIHRVFPLRVKSTNKSHACANKNQQLTIAHHTHIRAHRTIKNVTATCLADCVSA